MKIKTVVMDYDKASTLKPYPHKKPVKPNIFFRTLMKVLSTPALLKSDFTLTKVDMEKLGKDEPCLYLMNHSSFLDMKIATSILYPRPFNIITTSDAFVGMEWLMRQIGCVPTKKFVTDLTLVKDMIYSFKTLKSSALMYPEASYTFDGRATTLPESLAKCIKLMKVPVVMITTKGVFARDPLYNGLQLRKTKTSAVMKYLLSPDRIKSMSVEEIDGVLKEAFSFDNFRWQQENKIAVREPFRADYLNRVLYKCPHCMAEGKTEGKGTLLTCHACGKVYELNEFGYMRAKEGETEFPHIPDWYTWERACVRKELEEDTYKLEVPVDVCMMVNMKAIYKVGSGTLTHTKEGFRLTACDGKLDYTQHPSASYSLYSDYYWYELGDMVCIGTGDVLYYCFPKNGGDIVAKTRLAAEELYKMIRK